MTEQNYEIEKTENPVLEDDPNPGSQFLLEEDDELTGDDPVTPELRMELWRKGYGVVRKTDSGWKAVKRPS